MICSLSPYALILLLAAGDNIPALSIANIRIERVLKSLPSQDLCQLRVLLSDHQTATLQYIFAGSPPSFRYVQLADIAPTTSR
jgi:hypothetical protein